MQKQRHAAIYCRVSTDDQHNENQLLTLTQAANRHGYKITHTFTDELSGKDTERPAFKDLTHAITRREFDIILVWSVDRLGRSLQDLVQFLNLLHIKNIDLYIDQMNIDTTTPAGKALFQMLGVFAEFERSMIVERVNLGLQRARAEGKRLGAPTIEQSNPAVIQQIINLRKNKKLGYKSIAKMTNVGVGTVYKVLEKNNIT